mmetsp:Transcript_591/g.509  ORF Transcript_591/g.509 Transcript_591/m.509 type:complete len:159 (+) Transcript_591:530-1006(+)
MFSTPQREGDFLTVFNGIRVISLYFVVLGHTRGGMMGIPVINIIEIQTMATSWWTLYISIGYYSVDVFFFLSAFLAVYLMIGKFEGKGIFHIPMVYLHRIIRVVPSILIFTAMMIAFLQMAGSGPLWYPQVENILVGPCRKNWWTNIIFTTSFYPDEV